jgi:hypothetical protein
VAEPVVHPLEAVEVQQHEGQPLVPAARARDRLLEALVQRPAVRQAGEVVLQGEVGQAELGLLAPGHVGGDPDRAAAFPAASRSVAMPYTSTQ